MRPRPERSTISSSSTPEAVGDRPAGAGRVGRALLHPDAPLIALAAVMAVAAFDLLWRLGSTDLHFDEALYGRDGWNAIHGRVPTADHPVLGKLLIGLGQVIVGRNPVGMRIGPALVSWAGTLAVYGLGRRASRWTGVVAAALWATLGRDLVVAGHSTIATRVDRYALLDTVSTPLQLAAAWAALRWSDRPSLRRAALVGLLVGCAASTKLSALVVVPVVALVFLVARAGRSATLAGAVTAAGTAIIAFGAPFAVFGRAGPRLFREAWDVQRNHAKVGHVQVLGDQVYLREPWWANASFWWEAHGVVAVVLVVAALGAWWARDRVVVAVTWAMAGLTFAVLAFTPVALSHYWVQWLGALVVLAALGLNGLWCTRHPVARAVVVVAAAVLGAAGASATWDVARIERGPYQRMAADVRASGRTPEVAVSFGTDLAPYLPGTNSVFGGFASPSLQPDLLVIERQFAIGQANSDDLDRMRAQARAGGLTRRVRGDLEYWYRP